MVYPTLCLFYKRHTDGTIVGDFDTKSLFVSSVAKREY